MLIEAAMDGILYYFSHAFLFKGFSWYREGLSGTGVLVGIFLYRIIYLIIDILPLSIT